LTTPLSTPRERLLLFIVGAACIAQHKPLSATSPLNPPETWILPVADVCPTEEMTGTLNMIWLERLPASMASFEQLPVKKDPITRPTPIVIVLFIVKN
jgi:hypothetical protein